jgi:large subunit ribosomal protein L13
MIIDAENLIVGRLGTIVAKKALMGENVDIVNCEKAVIVGKKEEILRRYKEKKDRTTVFKGPFMRKMPDRFVRRIIRGMLPIEKTRGREAFKRVMCWIEVPDKFKNEKIEKIDSINVLNTRNIKYLQVEKICKYLGKKE